MDGLARKGATLAELAWAAEQGLELNRLLFVRYLVLTKRLTEELPRRSEPAESAV